MVKRASMPKEDLDVQTGARCRLETPLLSRETNRLAITTPALRATTPRGINTWLRIERIGNWKVLQWKIQKSKA